MITSETAKPGAIQPPPSTYLDADRYARLITVHSRGRGDGDADACAAGMSRLLAKEARLLDEQRFDEWLGLFARECIYWVPATWPPDDPAKCVAITLDDRRRLEDRVARYHTGYAFSQLPLSRTTRTLGAPECWWVEEGTVLLVRTSFHISELRLGEVNIYAGYYEHLIADPTGDAQIEEKRVHLLVADQPVKNISFLF